MEGIHLKRLHDITSLLRINATSIFHVNNNLLRLRENLLAKKNPEHLERELRLSYNRNESLENRLHWRHSIIYLHPLI